MVPTSLIVPIGASINTTSAGGLSGFRLPVAPGCPKGTSCCLRVVFRKTYSFSVCLGHSMCQKWYQETACGSFLISPGACRVAKSYTKTVGLSKNSFGATCGPKAPRAALSGASRVAPFCPCCAMVQIAPWVGLVEGLVPTKSRKKKKKKRAYFVCVVAFRVKAGAAERFANQR